MADPIKTYRLDYTGAQVNQAVGVAHNKISFDDLTEDFQRYLNQLGGGSSGEGVTELVFANRSSFPETGSLSKLYIATDEHKIYYFSNNEYISLSSTGNSGNEELEELINTIEARLDALEDIDYATKQDIIDAISNIELTPGPKGDKGDKGDQGEQGIQGEKGDKGDQGEKGDKGDPFTYDDFTPEQLASLKGEKGDKGDKGDAGQDGKDGADGQDGLTTSIKIGDNTYTHQEGVIDLTNYNNELTQLIQNKVDKVSEKQLSTEDFTTELKNKLEQLQNYDDSEILEKLNAIDLILQSDNLDLDTLAEIAAVIEGTNEDIEDLESRISALETQTPSGDLPTEWDADKVGFSQDLIFTKEFGKYVPDTTGSVTIPTATENMSLQDLLLNAFSEEKNPTTTDPTFSITSTNIGSKEVGERVSIKFGVSTTPGSYSYGPETGVVWSNFSATFNGQTITGSSGTFNEIQVTDDTNLSITGTADHNQGAIPVTNLGNPYEDGRIPAATSVSATKGTLKGYRKMFFGTVEEKVNPNSSVIRALSGVKDSSGACGVAAAKGTQTFKIPLGALRVYLAVPPGYSITECFDVNAFNTDLVATGGMKGPYTIPVMGKNEYHTSQESAGMVYEVWYQDFASANDVENTYKVTIVKE